MERLNPKTGKVKVVSDDRLLGGPGGITVGRGASSSYPISTAAPLDPARQPPERKRRDGDRQRQAGRPFDLAQARSGTIYVTDANAGPGATGAVFGESCDWEGEDDRQGAPFSNPYGLALGRHHKLYLADDVGKIFRVNIQTGAVRAIARGKPLVDPTGLEKGPDGKLYTTDYSAGPGNTAPSSE